MRDTNFQQLLDLSQRVIRAGGHAQAAAAGERVFTRLAAREGAVEAVEAQRLAVCHHLVEAGLAGLAAMASPLPELAASFAAVEALLRWERRPGAAPGTPFHDGHANAMLVGPGGLEERADVWVGASVMAPGISYPEHDHPPEEVYIALSPGQWWNAATGWAEPGPGGLFYNPPGMRHAMRAGDAPLLALWFLPVG